MKFKINHVNSISKRYKRVLFGGASKTGLPSFSEPFSGEETLEESILSENKYPCIIVWTDLNTLHNKYLEVLEEVEQ